MKKTDDNGITGEGPFSERVMEEYGSPYGFETLYDPDGHAEVKGSCGDSIEIFLVSGSDGRLRMAFRTDGCIPTVACGSMLCRMVKGRTPKEALELTEDDLIEALGGLPEDHRHCATLAIDTLFKALLDLETRLGPDRGPERSALCG